jgi:hypothetical protein
MYIDSLTITALVVFVIALALFVRYCIMSVCGLHEEPESHRDGGDTPRARAI